MKNWTILLFLLAAVAAHAQPKTSAPKPPARNAVDVISIYGDTYTNISNVNYNPFWGQSGMVNIAYNPGDSNLVLAYTNFNYQGTGFEANPQNASAMEFVHIDIWTSNATVVKFSPIDNSGDGPAEFLVDVPVDSGAWKSVDLPKSAFTGMSWKSIFQLKFDGQAGRTPSDIYLDNIYFWKKAAATGTDATLSQLQVDSLPVPGFNPSALSYAYGVPGGSPIPRITLATTTDTAAAVTQITQATAIPGDATVLVTAADGKTTATYTISFFYNSPATPAPTPSGTGVISLFSDAFTNVNVDNWNTSWSQAMYEQVSIAGNATKKYANVGFNGIETTSMPVNAGGMKYLHLDVWSPNMTVFNLKLVSFLGDGFGGPKGDSEANLNFNLKLGEWNTLQIPLADFTTAGMKSLDDLNQYIFTSTPFGSGIVFIDNVYFSPGVVNDVDDLETPNLQAAVYPNPAPLGSQVFLTSEAEKVELFGLGGQKLRTFGKSSSISLQGLDRGVYFIQLTDRSGSVATSKLVIR